MRFPILVVAFVLCSCEPAEQIIFPEPTGTTSTSTTSATGPGDNGSGTRLKVQYYAGEDGSRIDIGLYDSERKEKCGFGLAADEKTRCLPQPLAGTGSYFVDVDCTVPLAIAFGGECSPKPEYVSVAKGCGSRVHLAGIEFKGPNVFAKTASGCVQTPSPTSQSIVLFEVGDEVPASSFVEATVKTE